MQEVVLMIRKTDLSGLYKLFLDGEMSGQAGKIPYNDEIALPGTTSFAQKGAPNEKRETGFLTDAYKFEGSAWFKRKFEAVKDENERAYIFLERTRISEVYINGISAGVKDSFCAPHCYDVTDMIKNGENTLEIRVTNKGYKTGGGHMTSQDTQSNWNGITGEISIRYYNKTHLENVYIQSDIHNSCIYIKADIPGERYGTVIVRGLDLKSNKEIYSAKQFNYEDNKLDITFEMPGAKLWSEFSPSLYKIEISVGNDVHTEVAGLREFKTDGRFFTLNGRRTFLRGKHDGLIFPKTGYAPTDVESWIKVFKTSMSYGINHYRFHTCCPPEAAFIAADILGIYMEPQLPFWGTVTTEEDENHNAIEQEFLINEGFEMIKAFGNHPSFCMMSMGNELWGSKERINSIMGGYKKADGRHLYTQGSNNFQWYPNVVENDDFFVGVRLAKDRLIRGSYAMCDAPLGHVQTDRPSTMHNYDRAIMPAAAAHKTEASADGTVQIQFGTTMKTVKASDADADFIPDVPIVTHEIGQYETTPDFSEIPKYTGPLKARNFEVFAEKMKEKGLYPLWERFFKASGKLAASCYKEELEAIFRSSLIAGFQLLDIQDFSGQGTALVGILNAFMENKGNITPEEWREFCNSRVVLCEFPSYTYESKDKISVKLRAANFSESSLDNVKARVKLTVDDKVQEYETVIKDNGENFLNIADLEFDVPEISAPCKAELTVETADRDLHNHYTLWLYPKLESVDFEGVFMFESINAEAEKLLSEGKTVLIVPDISKLENAIAGFYCTDFWCYPMFSSISKMMNKPLPIGTMGLLIDNTHPVLSQFPSEFYSTHQWWEIAENSKSEILDGNDSDKTFIVRTIDNFERCHSLGLLYEYDFSGGKVVKANVDFEKLSGTPEGRWFIKSVTDYCRN